MKVVQLNVDLPETELVRIKKDSLTVGTTVKSYAQAAFKHFRSSLTVDQRRARFTKADRKILGRPVFFCRQP